MSGVISPQIFVASASEHADILTRLGTRKIRTGAKYLPWTDPMVCPAGEYTLPSLCRMFETVDGAAFLSMSVDKTWWRGETFQSPRDNVIFEAGLAIGYLGIERTAIVTDSEARLPSDLQGLTTIRFNASGDVDRDVNELHARLDTYFARIREPKRAVREMWNERRYAVYFHSFDNPEPGEPEEIVNFNAVRAIGHLSDSFGRLSVTYSFHSSRLEELHVEENLVLLGSSASNALTKRLHEVGSDRWRFRCVFDSDSMGNRAVQDKYNQSFLATELDGTSIRKDFGILTKVRNPFSAGHWLVMATGNYGYGTLGAIRAALDPGILASLPFDLDSEFQFVVEVPVTGRFSSGKPRMLKVERIHS